MLAALDTKQDVFNLGLYSLDQTTAVREIKADPQQSMSAKDLHLEPEKLKRQGIETKDGFRPFLTFFLPVAAHDIKRGVLNLIKKITGYFKSFIDIAQPEALSNLMQRVKNFTQESKIKPIILLGEAHNFGNKSRKIDDLLLAFLKQLKHEGYQTVSLEILPDVLDYINGKLGIDELTQKYNKAQSEFQPKDILASIPFKLSSGARTEIENFIDDYKPMSITKEYLQREANFVNSIKDLGFNVVCGDNENSFERMSRINFIDDLRDYFIAFLQDKEGNKVHQYLDKLFIEEVYSQRNPATAKDILSNLTDGFIHFGGADHMNKKTIQYRAGHNINPIIYNSLKRSGHDVYTINASLLGDANNSLSLKHAYDTTLIDSTA